MPKQTSFLTDDDSPRALSLEAFASVRDSLPDMEAKIYRIIRARGAQGATCDEIEVITGMKHQSVSPSLLSLRRRIPAIVTQAGTRPTRSGRRAAVWISREIAVRPEEI